MKAIRLLSGRFLSVNFIMLFFTVTVITSGCGGRLEQPPPMFSGSTNVTVLLSSTANDQLSQFDLSFSSLILTNDAGKTISLFNSSHNPEFIHLNGRLEPLLTISVPQGVYTAATASVGAASFTCSALDTSSGGIVVSTYAYGQTPSNQVIVNVPTPITITGSAMGLSLNMLVSSSASYPSTCFQPGIAQYSINPTFDLTPVIFSSQSKSNLQETELQGEISSINSADHSFTLTLAGGAMAFPSAANANGQTVSVNTNGSTTFQGVDGFSLLSEGLFVDVDLAIREDGSQLATRVEVNDTDSSNLSVSTGPLLFSSSAQPSLIAFGRQDQGYLRTSGRAGDVMPYSFGSAIFQISGRLTNLQTLPFVTTFNAANMFPGQNVYITTHALTLSSGPIYFPATTITLIPQTINGTINQISTDGAFTTYTVTLAPYDLIPDLAVQPGQNNTLISPSNVVVYVDGNTKMLNTKPLTSGGVARFGGMLFNDNGTLRMDCAQVNDGVNTNPQSNATSQPTRGKASIVTSTEGTRSSVPITVRTFLARP